MTAETKPFPGMPQSEALGRIMTPIANGRSCLYITAHAARRLQLRFGKETLGTTPFSITTHYCEPTDIDRPVWAIPISGKTPATSEIRTGYILGRWEQAVQSQARGVYYHWFVGTTCITEKQFHRSKLIVHKSIDVNVVRIMNELTYWKLKGIVEK